MAEQQRSTLTQTSFSPPQVRAVVNRFLLSQVGSVFAAGTPELDSATHLWHVPILADTIRILAIANQKRRPFYWRGRT